MSSTTAACAPRGRRAGRRRRARRGSRRRSGASSRSSPASRLALAGLVVFAIIVAGRRCFAPWIAPQNPYDLAQLDIMDGRLEPGTVGGAGFTYWLGTDDQGRDMLSGIMYGLRISLTVGAGSALHRLRWSAPRSGCWRPMRAGGRTAPSCALVDLQLSFPAILVALMILAFLGKGVLNVVIALVLVEWAYYARTVRGTALVERRREYIEAAQCLALPTRRIMFRHLLPNCLPPLIVVGTMQVARAIALEATLSFLGLGVPITEPSLGLLIANGYEYMLSGKYWISFYPGIALLVTIVSINLVGDHLRDVLNPRLEAIDAQPARRSRSATSGRTSSPAPAWSGRWTASPSPWTAARCSGWWAKAAPASPSPASRSWGWSIRPGGSSAAGSCSRAATSPRCPRRRCATCAATASP